MNHQLLLLYSLPYTRKFVLDKIVDEMNRIPYSELVSRISGKIKYCEDNSRGLLACTAYCRPSLQTTV